MEKRVFNLSKRRSTRFTIAFGVGCAALIGLSAWLWWHQRSHWWLMMNAWVVFWASWSSAFPQASKLEISDEGLFVTLRRGVGYMLRWGAITSVRLHERSSAARLWSAIIEDSQGHIVRVPRKCADKTEIIGLLKQRLPESVFQAW